MNLLGRLRWSFRLLTASHVMVGETVARPAATSEYPIIVTLLNLPLVCERSVLYQFCVFAGDCELES